MYLQVLVDQSRRSLHYRSQLGLSQEFPTQCVESVALENRGNRRADCSTLVKILKKRPR